MSLPIFGGLDIRSNSLLKFFEAPGNGTNSVALKSAAALAGDFTIILPAAQAANDDVVTAQSSGAQSYAKIANANIASGAAIDAAKIADGSVSSAEFQFINSLTSNAQTQIDGKASTALSNLASVAINTSLISDTNNTDDLGSAAIGWKDGFINRLLMDSNSQTTSLAGHASASASVNYQLPPAAPTVNGQILSSTTAGVMSWVTDAASSSFAADWLNADTATKVIAHNLNTKDVIVQVYNQSDDSDILIDSVVRTDADIVTLTASEAPAVSWRVVILAA